MGNLKWQQVSLILGTLVLLYGAYTYTDLFGALFNLKGVEYTHSGDIYCDETCESYINVTTSYWRICFAHYNNTKYENETLFKKVSRSRTLHINMDNSRDVFFTNPEVKTEWLVPARGKGNWRPLKDGDCWDRRKVNKIKIIGHKTKKQTVKWNLEVGKYMAIDPKWIGSPFSFRNQSALIKQRFSGLERYLFYNLSWRKESRDLIISLNVNRTVYNFLKDAYQNPTPQKCRKIQEYLEDDYPDITCQQIRDRLTNYIEKGWELFQNGVSKGFINVTGTRVTITIPNIRHRDRIKIGKYSIIFIYQDTVIMEFEDDYFRTNVTITAYKNISNVWQNYFLNITINETENGYKFTYFDENSTDTEINNYKIVYNSTDIWFKNDSDKFYFQRRWVETFSNGLRFRHDMRRYFSHGDICGIIFTDNGTPIGQGDCIFNLSGQTLIYNVSGHYMNGTMEDPYILDVIFKSNNNIDPTIHLGEVGALIGTPVQSRQEAKLIHIKFGEDPATELHDGIVKRYYPFDRPNMASKGYDYSDEDKDITSFNNNATYTPNGKYNGGLNFTQRNSYLSIEGMNYDDAGDYTWSFWVNLRNNTHSGIQTIHLQVQSLFGKGFWYGLNATGNFCFGHSTWFTTHVCGVTLPDIMPLNQWIHVAVVQSTENNISIYINGIFNFSGAATTSDSSSGFNPSLGSSSFISTSIDGSIDDFIMIDTNLTASQISDIYNETITRFYSSGNWTTALIDINQSVEDPKSRINITTPNIQGPFTGINTSAIIMPANASDYDVNVIPRNANLKLWVRFDNDSAFGENNTHFYDHINKTYFNCSGTTCPTYVDAKYFKGAEFDGIDDRLLDSWDFRGDWIYPHHMSACTWLTLVKTPTKNKTIISQDDIQRDHWLWEISGPEGDAMLFWQKSQTSSRNPTLFTGVEDVDILGFYQGFHFYCVTLDGDAPTGAKTDYYYDGVNEKSGIDQTAYDFSTRSNYQVVIGGTEIWETESVYQGILDDLMVWNVVLTDQNVEDLYNNGPFGFRQQDPIYFVENRSDNHSVDTDDYYVQIKLVLDANETRFYSPHFYGNLTLDTYFHAPDDLPPTYSDNKTNSTKPGEEINFSININDDHEISVAIFSFDNAIGTFTNDTSVHIGAGSYEFNNIKTISSVNGSTIRWQVFANDTIDQWNSSDIFTFVSDNTTVVSCTFDCSTNPTVNTELDCNGEDLIIEGSGTWITTANIINYGNVSISGGCLAYCIGACF